MIFGEKIKLFIRKFYVCIIFAMSFFCINTYADETRQNELKDMKATSGYMLSNGSVWCTEEATDAWLYCDELKVFNAGDKVDIVEEDETYYYIRWIEDETAHLGKVEKIYITKKTPKTYYVVIDTNLKSDATGYFDSGYTVKKNEAVTVIGELNEYNYYLVNVNGKKGYLHKNYLSGKKSTATRKYVVSYTNIKSRTNNKGSLITDAYMGEKIYVLGDVDKYGYYKTLDNNKYGYIKSDYLSDTKPVDRYAAYKVSMYKQTGGKKRIATIPQNSSIILAGKTDKKGYIRVFYNKKSGYIKASCVSPELVQNAYSQISINVYSKGTGRGKVGAIKANSRVFVICDYVTNRYGYEKILYKGKIRYARADYLAGKKSSTRYVNYKSYLENTKGKRIAVLKINTKVTLVGENNNYDDKLKIIYKGKVGYIERWRLFKRKVSNSNENRFSADVVMRKMKAMYSVYPEGRIWTNANYYGWKGGIYTGGYGCAGFAFHLSDAAFDNLPARLVYDFSNLRKDLRVGDIIRVYGDTHSVIIIEKTTTGVVLAEGNYNSMVHWGRTMSYAELERDITYYMTRYPK